MEMLATIPQDQSYGQGEGLLELSKLSLFERITFSCFDLENFTDKFPFRLIFEWIIFMYGTLYADAIQMIMVGLEFEVQRTTQKVRYKTGNPMGFYGSFALTSLMHHFIFFECCLELGIN
jgi:hypothetical protein